MCFLFSKDLIENKLKTVFIVVYYSIQVFSSLLILLSVTKIRLLFFENRCTLLFLGVLIKIGFWPFHSWYLKMIERLEIKFSSLWVMITWQKLMPLFIILFSRFLVKNYLFISLTLINLFQALVYLKSAFNVKSTLGFSSMRRNSWLTSLVLFSLLVWKIFFFFYSLRIILIIVLSNTKWLKTKSSLLLIFLVFNIGGLPPLIIFWAKVISIKAILFFRVQKEVIILLILTACYFVFFYLYIILTEFLLETFN